MAGKLSRATRWRLAKQAFATTAAYDAGIASALEALAPTESAHAPAVFRRGCAAADDPHHRAADGSAAVWRESAPGGGFVCGRLRARGLPGQSSFRARSSLINNLVDLDACWELVSEFEEPAVVIIKHTNPCGASTGRERSRGVHPGARGRPGLGFWRRAWDQPGGRCGGRGRDCEAFLLRRLFAPAFSPDALARLGAKKNLRLIQITPAHSTRVIKQISGGLLVQSADHKKHCGGRSAYRHQASAVPGRAPCPAFCVGPSASMSKSNAIVLRAFP